MRKVLWPGRAIGTAIGWFMRWLLVPTWSADDYVPRLQARPTGKPPGPRRPDPYENLERQYFRGFRGDIIRTEHLFGDRICGSDRPDPAGGIGEPCQLPRGHQPRMVDIRLPDGCVLVRFDAHDLTSEQIDQIAERVLRAARDGAAVIL